MSVFNPELREFRESKFEANKFSPNLEKRLLKALDDGKETYADIIQCPSRSCGTPLKIEMRQDSVFVYCTNCGWQNVVSRQKTDIGPAKDGAFANSPANPTDFGASPE